MARPLGEYINVRERKFKQNYLLHAALFLITFITTTISGMVWITGYFGPYELSNLAKGLPYSIAILFFLASHEFGHFFASKYHKVKATLPYFIPLPPLPGFFHFGTMGAVIKTKSRIQDNKAMFDIGAAGPIAGFIACLIILVYGFTHLPGTEYILSIHPDYFDPSYGKTGLSLRFGDTILFAVLRELLTEPGQFVPPMTEIYHYPYLCVGWFGLLVTSLNMIPVGQLDGGHIVYSMFGDAVHSKVAHIFVSLIGLLGFLGIISYMFDLNMIIGWTGWIFWGLILLFIIKIKHPPVLLWQNLDKRRMIYGWITLIILMLSFSPTPISITMNM
jgi:membrane-associated protease RseP (regulator of RpoE activity)